MEPEASLPCSKEPVTYPYPKADTSSPHTFLPYFLQIHANIILASTPWSSVWSLLLNVVIYKWMG